MHPFGGGGAILSPFCPVPSVGMGFACFAFPAPPRLHRPGLTPFPQVLQRGAPMCIWGWTSHEGMPVSVTLKDPQNRSLEVRSATPALSPGGSDWNPGPNPRWGACLGRTPRRDAPGLARARYRVEVAVRADGLWVALELRGVRFGDVYVCAGQSNVVFPSCLDVIPEDCPAVEPHPDVHVLSLAFLAKGPPLSDAYTTVSRNTVWRCAPSAPALLALLCVPWAWATGCPARRVRRGVRRTRRVGAPRLSPTVPRLVRRGTSRAARFPRPQ